MAGKGVGTRQKFLPFKRALLYARSLKLKSCTATHATLCSFSARGQAQVHLLHRSSSHWR